MQDQERAAAPRWDTMIYGGERINLVFTNPPGGLVLHQAVAKIVKQAGKAPVSLPTSATHTGRRTVVTTLSGHGGHRSLRGPRPARHHRRLRQAPRPPAPRRSLNGPPPSSTGTTGRPTTLPQWFADGCAPSGTAAWS